MSKGIKVRTKSWFKRGRKEKSKPVSRWSPSPPRSKLRRPESESGWPVRYEQIHSKNRKKLSTWLQLHLYFSKHRPKKHGWRRRLVFVWPLTTFYKQLGNNMFPVNGFSFGLYCPSGRFKHERFCSDVIKQKKMSQKRRMPNTTPRAKCFTVPCGFGCWR